MKGSKKSPHAPELSVPVVDLGQIERLVSFMSEHGLEEFEYADGDLRIRLKKAAAPLAAPSNMALPAASSTAPQILPQDATPQAESARSEGLHIIKSPIVGTFYAGSSPESGAFVRVGDTVKAGQTVCIIEAMKLMNEIEADISGEVAQILVENGQPVDYGKPLFALRPVAKKMIGMDLF